MKSIFIVFLFLTIHSGVRAQDCSVLLNHFLIVVDSTTYQAIENSEILHSDFAFAYARNKSWEGIYIIGKDNYIEVFHPNSIRDEHLPVGFTWICHASMLANCTENYVLPENDLIDYSTDEYYDELSVSTRDSSTLFTTREINKKQYESWTRKEFNDSLVFLTTDYNSPAESDSSKNYLFKNITGIEVVANSKDSSNIIEYLHLIGYRTDTKATNKVRFSNSKDFVELSFSEDVEIPSISVIHFELNAPVEQKRIVVGTSEIILDGIRGKWEVNKSRLTQADFNK